MAKDTSTFADAPVSAAVPAAPRGDDEYPVPFVRFAARLRHTTDEVWTKLLHINHGRENHTLREWRALLEKYRHQPAHPGP